jgi:hypothetical protein
MKKPELDCILKQARMPAISGESLEMFPRKTMARLKQSGRPVSTPHRYSPRLAWAFGLATCVIIAYAIGRWSGGMAGKPVPAPDTLASMKLIRETLSMFPNRVRAIVRDEHGINLVLSDKPDVPVSEPIYVQISDGNQTSSLITFSGQEVQIAGQQVTVLADGRGGVILAGQHFVWSDSRRVYAGGDLKIKAETLGVASM